MTTKTSEKVAIELLPSTSRRAMGAGRQAGTWGIADSSNLTDRYVMVLQNLTDQALPEPTLDSVRAMLHEGLSAEAFLRLQQALGVSASTLASVTGISVRGLPRRPRLPQAESERLLRVATVFQRALEFFGDLAKARRWFVAPRDALAGKSPLEYCDTDPGAREVEQLLGRLAHGVFS